MEGSSEKKSVSLQTLVIKNISNVNELKAKLNEIISAGKSYEYDVSSCLKSLLKSNDSEIVILAVQAVSELTKCERKREYYADKDTVTPILDILTKEITSGTAEVFKHCLRALGNLCCDCDAGRNAILDSKGIPIIINVLERTVNDESKSFEEIKVFAGKMLLNFAIGGIKFCESLVKGGLVQHLHKILTSYTEKGAVNEDMVSTTLLLLNVINDNLSDILFELELNTTVLSILKETTNVEVSELCLDHFHSQAEHDSVKTLLADKKGIHLVCHRLEQLVQQIESGEVNADDEDVQGVMKQACDLIIIVLTGDEAMHILYENGTGEVYTTMVKWMDSSNYNLLTTAVLAIGNFARQDDYCTKMMEDKIFNKLLDLFETYHAHGANIKSNPKGDHPVDLNTVTKIEHAVLSAIRNLTVPVANKREAAAQGRAAPLLLNALPSVEDNHVAYKMLAAIRMLVDGQVEVGRQLSGDRAALAAVARWGQAGQFAGAGGEAPRLLAWCVRALRGGASCRQLVQVDGCLSSLINMLVVCHSVMQNESILALTILAIESLKPPPDTDFDYEKGYMLQLTNCEIGKHVAVLIETNCAKMPVEVAENLLAFLEITSKKTILALDYKEAKIHESLQKFKESRKDLSDELKARISNVITTITISNGLMDVE